MNNYAIEVKNISKNYVLGSESYLTLRDSITSTIKQILGLSKKQKAKSSWALKNVSFNVNKGEVLGIIGNNGAGKSTLLKILSRITEPTEGEVMIRGKIASLLEVGTGFNPELTGRENIYLNGAILGMSRSEINLKIDEIIRFADIGKYLDEPVKYYSSGMYMRLAFSIAANLEADILLLDEVMAVGDLEFQKKSSSKIQNIVEDRQKTVVFVSHGLDSVNALCTKVLVLENGVVTYHGGVKKGIDKYVKKVLYRNVIPKSYVSLLDRKNPYGKKKFVSYLKLMDKGYVETTRISMGDKLVVEIGLKNFTDSLLVGIIFHTPTGTIVSSTNCGMSLLNRSGRNKAIFTLTDTQFAPGDYKIDISVTQGTIKRLDYISNAATISVDAHDVYRSGYLYTSGYGTFYLHGAWEII